MITGNITVITVVVSISQLLLSKELKTPDKLQSQLNSAIEYRENIEDAVERVPPVEPLEFLRYLVETTRQDAQQLGGLARSETDETVYKELSRAITEVTNRADRIDEHLQRSNPARITVVSATLTTDFADVIRHLRQIQARNGDRLSDGVCEIIDDLIRHLEDIGIARQYFKTIYLQKELAVLSRILFFVGLPSVTIVIGGLFLFTAPSGASVSRSTLTILMPMIITIGLVPLIVLFAFILRIATVSQRTAAMLPFTTLSRRRESYNGME